MSPAAQGVLDELDADGRAHIPIPRRLGPGELAAALMATGRLATEVAEARPDDLYMAVVRGAKIRKPPAEWVWIFWTEEGAQLLEDATRRELGL
ncbi:MAG: hypothetical protein H0T70_01630 [Acidimicrobiia bacterium]|nr:hypothetical protein [Acidimicrobiia bacterium]